MSLQTCDLIASIRISEVWSALGGPPLRHGRGRAWWRNGDGYNVSVNDDRGAWFDHAQGQGGGVLDLVQTVLGCSRTAAFNWIAEFAGVPIDSRTPPQDLRRACKQLREERRAAQWWAVSVRLLSEELLQRIDPCHEDRRPLTRLKTIIAGGTTGVVQEYRTWLTATPALTRAMVRAGRSADIRRQRQLAAFIVEMADAA
jgi:hypothetical protein